MRLGCAFLMSNERDDWKRTWKTLIKKAFVYP
jgi:hypothetical protein